jgi:ABC-type sugar transport system permease subunit
MALARTTPTAASRRAHERPPRPARSAKARAERRFGLLLALPATLLVLVLVAGPALQTVVYSFEKVPLDGASSWVGLDNYQRLFGNEAFVHSLVVTGLFTAGFLVVSTLAGLLIALLLNQRFVGRGVARTLLIVPWACPWIVVGIVWKWFVDGDVGALNAGLTQLGLQSSYHAFLADGTWALVLAILAAAWRQASFAGLMFLAALQTIPAELLEAARVDGASRRQQLTLVTLPWLRPIMVVVVVIDAIYGFLQFDVIYAMTQGGPGDATNLLGVFLYRQLFEYTDIGGGSAVAVVLALIALLVGLLFVRVLYRSDAEARA